MGKVKSRLDIVQRKYEHSINPQKARNILDIGKPLGDLHIMNWGRCQETPCNLATRVLVANEGKLWCDQSKQGTCET